MVADTQFKDKIAGVTAGKVLFDEPMSAHTSMGVGGRVDALVFPDTVENLGVLVSFLLKETIPFLPMVAKNIPSGVKKRSPYV